MCLFILPFFVSILLLFILTLTLWCRIARAGVVCAKDLRQMGAYFLVK